jgi:molybdopterin converting factor small subunit
MGFGNIPPEAPKVIFLNGVHATGNEVLKEGDRVGAFPPVAGG